jgi:hypothetical protein
MNPHLFFFVSLNPIYCPVRPGLTLDFTFVFVSPLAPMPAPLLPPRADPARKRCDFISSTIVELITTLLHQPNGMSAYDRWDDESRGHGVLISA